MFTFLRPADPVGETLREIDQLVTAMSRESSAILQQATVAKQSAVDLTNDLVSPRGCAWALDQSLQLLNRSAACFTHDVELLVTAGRAPQYFTDFAFEPIIIETSVKDIKATPDKKFVVRFESSLSQDVRPDGMVVDTYWTVEGFESTPQKLNVRLYLSIYSQGGSRMGVIQTRGLRVFDDQGRLTDPLAQLPVRDRIRQKAREKLWTNIATRLAQSTFELPNLPSELGGAKPSPHTFTGMEDQLLLVSRILAKRRKRFVLARPIEPPWNQAIRVKGELLEAEMRRQIGALADVESIQFQLGSIYVRVHKFHHEDVCWASVDVHIWIDYRVTIENDLPYVLFMDAFAMQSTRSVKASSCWPVCGKIEDAANKQVDQELPKYTRMTFPFANLWKFGTRVLGRVEPFGITILMQGR